MITHSKILKYARSGIYPVLMVGILAMLILSISRIMLTMWQSHLVEGGYWGHVLLQGVRVDFASVCALYAIPLMVLILFSISSWFRVPRFIVLIIKWYCILTIPFLVFNEVNTPSFIIEYGVRPNEVYVHNFKEPMTLLSTLLASYKLNVLVSLVLTIAAGYASYRINGRYFRHYRQATPSSAVTALILVVCFVPLGIRSTTGSHPFNPAMIEFSDSALANSLPLNSSYSAAYALWHYQELKKQALIDIAKHDLEIAQEALKASEELNDVAQNSAQNTEEQAQAAVATQEAIEATQDAIKAVEALQEVHEEEQLEKEAK